MVNLTTQGQNIIFEQPLDSINNADLNINTQGGAIAIQSNIGNIQPLGALTLAGPTQLNANINTQGNKPTLTLLYSTL